jgi:hypothetical protein
VLVDTTKTVVPAGWRAAGRWMTIRAALTMTPKTPTPRFGVRSRRALTPLVVAVTLSTFGLSACGGDDEPATTSQPGQTQTATTDDQGVSAGKVAAAAASFLIVRRQLNKREAEVEQLEAEVEKANAQAAEANAAVKQAEADAEKAKQDAEKAEQEASSASDVAKAEAEAEQAKADVKAAEAEAKEAEAEKNESAAKAEAAGACATAMFEIIAKVPKASSLADGLQQAGDDLKALAPKCKDSIADAGG